MDTKTIGLANRTRFMCVLNFPCDLVPECAKPGVVGTVDYDVATGGKSVRAHKKSIAGSVTLLAAGDPDDGDVVYGLPRSVLKAPDVKAALQAGRVAIVEGAKPEKPASKPETGDTTPEDTEPEASAGKTKKGSKE